MQSRDYVVRFVVLATLYYAPLRGKSSPAAISNLVSPPTQH